MDNLADRACHFGDYYATTIAMQNLHTRLISARDLIVQSTIPHNESSLLTCSPTIPILLPQMLNFANFKCGHTNHHITESYEGYARTYCDYVVHVIGQVNRVLISLGNAMCNLMIYTAFQAVRYSL
jgi:hypothetical protein